MMPPGGQGWSPPHMNGVSPPPWTSQMREERKKKREQRVESKKKKMPLMQHRACSSPLYSAVLLILPGFDRP